MRLLFVCLGNICRSPTAMGVMSHLLKEEGLEDEIEVDSVGTGNYQIGKPPDSRAASAARARGIVLEGKARQIRQKDFDRADLVLAMDRQNARDVLSLAPDEEASAKVRLLREFDPEASAGGDLDVPDPYYGEADRFEEVLDLVERACRGLIADLRANLRR